MRSPPRRTSAMPSAFCLSFFGGAVGAPLIGVSLDNDDRGEQHLAA
jgi:hypothetical protein